jgi:hypothetical protein
MHGPVAAGKVTAITFNDEARQIEICAKVVDDAEWAKVLEGVYTGFSQGGSYAKRWTDTDGRNRYTAQPNEISLVDLPCLPQATFEMIKADGTSERRRFGQGLDNAARIARLVEELEWLQNAPPERGRHKGPAMPSESNELAARASHILRTMVADETSKSWQATDLQARPALTARPQKASPRKSAVLAKASDRHNASDQTMIHHMHDASVELGAVCDAQKFAQGPLEKRFDKLSETIADILRRVKNIEEQPLPLPFLGHPRAVSKAEEAVSEESSTPALEKLLANPETLSVMAIKLAQRNGRSLLR